MALAELNPMFMNASGKIDRLVQYNRRGTQCIRRHVFPFNPNTPGQQAVRSSFRDAVHAWQVLPDTEKAEWNHKARYRNATGYNMFVSWYLKQNIPAALAGASHINKGFPSHPAPNSPRFPSVGTGSTVRERSLCAVTGQAHRKK